MPKEGVDFEWVTRKGTNAKTRRFFTAAEKKAMKNPPKKKAAPAKRKAPSKAKAPAKRSTKSIVEGARKAIEASGPKKPMRPKARPASKAKTATSVRTPKVATSKLAAKKKPTAKKTVTKAKAKDSGFFGQLREFTRQNKAANKKKRDMRRSNK